MTKPHSVEEAARRAWPAAEEIHVGPWLARFTDGYTLRVNSATLVADSIVAEP
jgi:hypothetical protein